MAPIDKTGGPRGTKRTGSENTDRPESSKNFTVKAKNKSQATSQVPDADTTTPTDPAALFADLKTGALTSADTTSDNYQPVGYNLDPQAIRDEITNNGGKVPSGLEGAAKTASIMNQENQDPNILPAKMVADKIKNFVPAGLGNNGPRRIQIQ